MAINVFDLFGRKILTIVSDELQAGFHNVVWNGNTSPAGLYLVKMEVNGFSASKKVLLIK